VSVIEPPELPDLFLPVCAAVAAAHDEGVVHRDLKPENLFLARTRDRQLIPKVLDFGISRIVDVQAGVRLTDTSAVLGTPLYMAPEQVTSARTADMRSDQFSLGVVLYECACGSPPWVGETLYAVLDAIAEGRCERPRQRRPELDAGFEAVVLRAMAHAPEDRFPSVRALGAALLPFASERARAQWQPVLAVLPSPPTWPPPGAGNLLAGSPETVVPRSAATLPDATSATKSDRPVSVETEWVDDADARPSAVSVVASRTELGPDLSAYGSRETVVTSSSRGSPRRTTWLVGVAALVLFGVVAGVSGLRAAAPPRTATRPPRVSSPAPSRHEPTNAQTNAQTRTDAASAGAQPVAVAAPAEPSVTPAALVGALGAVSPLPSRHGTAPSPRPTDRAPTRANPRHRRSGNGVMIIE
jgi:serine/threonine protein kinase